MSKKVKLLIWIGASVLVLALAAFACVGYLVPYLNASTAFDKTAPVIFTEQADGKLKIEWPSADADGYLVEIFKEGSEQAQYSAHASENTVTVDALSGRLTLKIRTVGEYSWPFIGEPRMRVAKEGIVISGDLTAPRVKVVETKADDIADTVSVKLELEEGCIGRLYFFDGDAPVYRSDIEGDSVKLEFGDGKAYKMPAYGQTARFCFDSYRRTDKYVYYGKASGEVSVVREELLGTDLVLTCTEEANDSVTFTWNETKGDYYLLQRRASEKSDWSTVVRVEASGERVFRINGLEPYSYEEFRVIARHSADTDETEPVAQTEAYPLKTESVLQYSTVWNIQELEIYSDSLKTETLGKIAAGTAFSALDIENGMFYVRWSGGYGYIDSNYCLINLPEFLGELCKYDITNSYSSLYKFHSLPIPEVTDTVIIGYENVKRSNTEYLAPLLYPTALKFEKAAKKARDDGYYVKIYDSFRPQAATWELYKVATEHCKREVTEEDLASLPEDERPVIEEGVPYTYDLWVTDNGRYHLNYFLAKGISMHNRGLALDMTLEKNGEDLEMQSDMHDLTWHSEIKQNNKNANLLAKYMKNEGFAGLVSEWWHFQDNEARDTIKPTPLYNGVSLKGWVADENGWRYRTANGTLYKNCTREIDGASYEFDTNGYLIEKE